MEFEMNIIINNSSMQPIYEQIVDQIKASILNGSLTEGAMLPSVRALSKDLSISALTVKKAYDALERAGFLTTVHGKGSFVAGINSNLAIEEQKRNLEKDLEEVLKRGLALGIESDELITLCTMILDSD